MFAVYRNVISQWFVSSLHHNYIYVNYINTRPQHYYLTTWGPAIIPPYSITIANSNLNGLLNIILSKKSTKNINFWLFWTYFAVQLGYKTKLAILLDFLDI